MAGNAIVIGAGMAGLCAARVLSRSFEKVLVLERDELPQGAASRPGTPQARHVHALITRGSRELERLFPGFLADYKAAGAHEIDVPYEGALLRRFGWQQRMRSDCPTYFATRDLTESIVRRRVLAISNVEVRDHTEAAGLIAASGDAGRVSGVRAKRRGGGGAFELAADLIVDASGRSSKAPAWLEELGRAPAPEEVVDSFAGYSSRWYEAPEPSRRPSDQWWRMIWIDPAPPEQLLGGVLFPVEENRFIVTLIGYSRNYPPNDEAGFERALSDVRSPILARTVAPAKPVTSVYSNRALANRRRRYEKIADPLAGFIAMSDSVCTFNPMFGQGMTVATLCALALEETLALCSPTDPRFPGRFFAAQAGYAKDAWSIATGADMQYPATQSAGPPPTWFNAQIANAIQLSALVDPVVLRRTSAVYSMCRRNRDLFDRALLARVLFSAARETLARRLQGRSISPMPPPRSA